MARKDQITGKGPLKGNSRSKALNASKKTWNPNLQTVTVVIDGKKQKIRVSAKTLRSIKNNKKV